MPVHTRLAFVSKHQKPPRKIKFQELYSNLGKIFCILIHVYEYSDSHKYVNISLNS